MPIALVEELEELRVSAQYFCFVIATRIVMILDERDLLSDQLVVGPDDEGGVIFEWPFFGLYLEIIDPDKRYALSFSPLLLYGFMLVVR